MRWISFFGVLCFVVAPAFGDACEYTFDVDPGNSSVEVTIQGEGATVTGLDGTFCATIYASDGHIGSSDTFVLCGANIYNTSKGEISVLGGLLTASVDVGDLVLFAFDPNYPSGGIHIGEGGEFSDSSGAHFSAHVIVVVWGLINTTISTSITSEVAHVSGTITTSAEASDTIFLNLNATATSIPIEITALNTTLFLDLDVQIEGTAHASPDPALGGMIALGLGGAGTWLRRRRRG
jgi:hypothetical protein